jgi:membrane associated rhomboid family serine protease
MRAFSYKRPEAEAPMTKNDNDKPQAAKAHEPAILLPGIITALIGLMVAVQLARVFSLTPDGDLNLMLWTAFLPVRFVVPDQIDGGLWPLIWTPITYAFLHQGWEHLIINCAWLAIFGTPVARRYGAVPTLMLFAISSIAGAALFAVTSLPPLAPLAPHFLLGASGGISGLTGAACRFMFQPLIVARDPETGEARVLGRRLASFKELALSGNARFFIVLWLVMNAAVPFLPMLFGADSGISWQAHLGGFLVGLVAPTLIEHRRKEPRA